MDRECFLECERRITLDKDRLFFFSHSEVLEYLSEKYHNCPTHGPILTRQLQEDKRKTQNACPHSHTTTGGGSGGSTCKCTEIAVQDWIKFAATDNVKTSTFLGDLKGKLCQRHSESLASVSDSSPRSKLAKVIFKLLS